jgi:hypothetical protein
LQENVGAALMTPAAGELTESCAYQTV